MRPSLFRSFVQRTLSSSQDIASFLNTPTWTSRQLLGTSSITASSSQHAAPIADSALIGKLLKQSGLMPVSPGSPEESKIISDLKGQLVFVNHISEVDTNGIEPLISLGEVKNRTKIRFEDIIEDDLPGDDIKWKPTDLAREKNGPFYVLKEGLRKD